MLRCVMPTGLTATVAATALPTGGRCPMLKIALTPGTPALAAPAVAQVPDFPSSFKAQEITTNGATIHVRVGGQGPAVVLLHGYGETGDMWAPMAADLARNYTVVVPDLRGLGLSSKPQSGF